MNLIKETSERSKKLNKGEAKINSFPHSIQLSFEGVAIKNLKVTAVFDRGCYKGPNLCLEEEETLLKDAIQNEPHYKIKTELASTMGVKWYYIIYEYKTEYSIVLDLEEYKVVKKYPSFLALGKWLSLFSDSVPLSNYEEVKTSYKLELILNKKELSTIKSPLTQNGDFRSSECIEILKEADIVVTNPPFSLFREYIAQLMEYQKDFIVIGSQNALTYKELFPLFKKNKMWIGYNSGAQEFRVPDTYERNNIYIGVDGYKYAKFGNITWYTNLEISKRHEIVPLYKKYNALEYPKYDDYDAINVSKISEIPYDYKGKMGVPVTILEKFNPDQFELIGIDRYLKDNPQYGRRFKINGKEIYARIVIKNKKVK